MAKKRAVVEYQQQLAQKKLERYELKLKERKIDPRKFRNDPLWRHLQSKLTQLKLQIKYVEKRESFNKKAPPTN